MLDAAAREKQAFGIGVADKKNFALFIFDNRPRAERHPPREAEPNPKQLGANICQSVLPLRWQSGLAKSEKTVYEDANVLKGCDYDPRICMGDPRNGRGIWPPESDRLSSDRLILRRTLIKWVSVSLTDWED